jgi:hypothetical protein
MLDLLVDVAAGPPSMVMLAGASLPRRFLAGRCGAVTRPGLGLVGCWSLPSTRSQCCHLLAQQAVLLD